MPKTASNNRAIMLAVTTALASTLLAGCATTIAKPADLSASKVQPALAKGKTGQAVEHAEAAVLAEPRDAGYRAMLGAVYMEAGRFQSAARSFKDAMELGDSSGRTALSFALAQIAAGDQNAALSALNANRNVIDPSDLGLALSLAGKPDQGVHVLGNALRGGMETPKVRQNLAYSYALMGNWRAARLMAAEDVPADQLGDRMSEWAENAAPENYHARVAQLMNVPVVSDSGQPAMLALSNHTSVQQLASASVAQSKGAPSAELPATSASAAARPAVASAPAAARPAVASVPAAVRPPVASAPAAVRPAVASAPAAARPPVASTAYALPPLDAAVQPTRVAANNAPPVAQPKPFEQAFTAGNGATPAVSAGASNKIAFVSTPVVQKTPTAVRAAPVGPASTAPASVAQAKTSTAASTAPASVAQAKASTAAGDHLIQLGSFSNQESAERAWNIYVKRFPDLAKHKMVITQAKVRGKTYFRVSAGGFQRASAASMCSAVKASNQGCIAWTANGPLLGAVDRNDRLASR